MGKVDIHKKICDELNALYARKNADYGDSFGKSFNEYGLTMACIRLEDKLNRIKALRNKDAQVADESITDTLMDLANYSIMTLVEMAQGKSDDAPHGFHKERCGVYQQQCICLTCANDDRGVKSHSCCIEHNKDCTCTTCLDYVPEEG